MGRPDNTYTVAEFARGLGTTKDTLLHYDRIGLFRPDHVAENGYRYYSARQIWLFTQIQNLKKMGLGLREIREYMNSRTSASYVDLLERQIEEASSEINRLYEVIDSMELSLRGAREALSRKEGFAVEKLEPVWGIRTSSPEEAFGKDFLKFWKRLDRQYGFSCNTLTGAVRMDEILAGIDSGDQCEYLYLQLNPLRHHDAEIVRPGGDYLVGYHAGRDSELMRTYQEMIAWGKKKKLRFGKYGYEDYVISQIAVPDGNRHVTRVSIQLEQE